MKVQLEKTFPMPGSADAAWVVLQDIDAVAGCMPGAKITERIDATHFKGTVGVKFGPASMSFRGDVEILSLDAAGRTLRLMGKGTDSTGSSGASMDLTARVEAIDAAACNLVGTSEVAMSGKAAAFGGRMMDSVADQVLKQFAANFAGRVKAVRAAGPVGGPAEPASPAIAAEVPSGAGVAAGSPAASTLAGTGVSGTTFASEAALTGAMSPTAAASLASPTTLTPASSSASTAASTEAASLASGAAGSAQVGSATPVRSPGASVSTSAAPSVAMVAASTAPAEAAQLNAFAIAWAIFKDWLRSLFGARRA